MALNSIDSLASRLIFRLGGEEHERFIRLYLGWKRVVGELLAERSHPVKIERDILFVGVENNAWMQELNLMKTKIIKEYKSQYHEEIQDIVLMIRAPKKRKK